VTAPNPNASLPSVATEGQYRLGDDFLTDPSDLWLNTTWADGTHVVAAEPSGWEGLEFVTPIDTSGGRDGGLDGPQSIAPRTLPVAALMVAPDAGTLRRAIATLRRKLGPRRRVVWEQHDFGQGRRLAMICRAQGDFFATPTFGTALGGVASEVTFTLVAANPPYKLSTGAPEFVDIGLPVDSVSGRTYNKTYSYNYGASTNPGGIGQAENTGDVDAWPLFEITGPVNRPILDNQTTGRSFLVVGNIAAGQTVTIDSRTGRVTPASYRLVGRPWVLVPGVNNLRWRASSGSFDPSANLRVIWRSTSE
jgi:Phage tail protein